MIRISSLLSAAALVIAASSQLKAAPEKPNIILIFSDDQRFNTIHALGNEVIQTPHLDSLVRSGTTFSRAYMMGSQIGATCIPSRAMLLSGRSLYQLGWRPNERNSSISPEHTTIPEALRPAGYTTFITGKWHNDRPSILRMFDSGSRVYGFSPQDRRSHYLMSCRELQNGDFLPDAHVYERGPDGKAIQTVITEKSLTELAKIPVEELETKYLHTSEIYAESAVDFIRDYRKSGPFFMYLAFHAPHDPRTAPKEYRDLYPPEKLPLPASFVPEHPFDIGVRELRDELLAGYPRTPAEVRQHLSDYYAMISHMDAQIGRVLAAIKASGHAQNTIIVFSGDSGLAVGDHGLMGKQNLYDAGGIHVPLIFAGPGIPQGEKRDALVYTFDILPTLCSLGDTATPSTASGKNLLPIIDGSSPKVRDYQYFAYGKTMRAVQDERFKLIVSICGGKIHNQLFDLKDDPDETRNLADNPQFAPDLTRLRSELLNSKTTYHEDDAEAPEFWSTYNLTP